MTRSLRLGDKWFLVSTDWWQRVVERGEDASASSSSDTRIRNADLVDAARSCRCCSRSLLHAGLVKSVDYRVVNERVWRALALEFGYDWEISREVVDDGHGLTIDVYPSGLQDGGGPGHTSPPAADSHRSEVAVDLSIEAMEQWRSDLKLGQLVDALDTDSKWYEARVVDLADARAKVHYRGWSAKWDEWLERTSPRLMPLHSKVRDWRRFRVNDAVQLGETRPGQRRMEWRNASVLATVKSLLVQLSVDGEVHWMDAQDERLCPPGTHRATNASASAEMPSPSATSATTGSSSNNSTPTTGRRKRLRTSSYAPPGG